MQCFLLIPIRRPDQVLTYKKKMPSVGYAVPVNHEEEIKESYTIYKYLYFFWEQNKL